MKKKYEFTFLDMEKEEQKEKTYPEIDVTCPNCRLRLYYIPLRADFEEDGTIELTCACGQKMIASPYEVQPKKDRRFDHELPKGIVYSLKNIYVLNERIDVHIDKVAQFLEKELGDHKYTPSLEKLLEQNIMHVGDSDELISEIQKAYVCAKEDLKKTNSK